MITGCLQKKNGYYYAVLHLKVDGKRKTKWIATKLPVSTTSERKAQKALDEIRMQYELQEKSKQETTAASVSEYAPEAQALFVDYMEKWLDKYTALYRHRHLPELFLHDESAGDSLLYRLRSSARRAHAPGH